MRDFLEVGVPTHIKIISEDLTAKDKSEAEIEQLIAHKIHQGNRPTTSMILDVVDAKAVGRLIALYEHKIFCQGIILEICSFDQWGVELGKGLASAIEKELKTDKIKNCRDNTKKDDSENTEKNLKEI